MAGEDYQSMQSNNSTILDIDETIDPSLYSGVMDSAKTHDGKYFDFSIFKNLGIFPFRLKY